MLTKKSSFEASPEYIIYQGMLNKADAKREKAVTEAYKVIHKANTQHAKDYEKATVYYNIHC